MAFGFRKTATAVKKKTGQIDNQQDATILIYLFLIGFTCFGRCFRPSSGAHRRNYSFCCCPWMLLLAGVAYWVEGQFHPIQ